MTDRHVIDAVFFDFSGTLFRFEERDEWFDDVRQARGPEFDIHSQAELIRRMTAPVGAPVDFSPADAHAWSRRDLDPALHRQAYMAMLGQSGIDDPEHADALYERLLDPVSWIAYPDTGIVLNELAAAGIPVGIVSNIPFDLREVFALYGWQDLVSGWSLSFEVGATKPDAAIFRHALAELGADPARALMVGDSVVADGAARYLGMAFAEVQPLPVAQRRDAIIGAVRAAGVL